MSNANPTITEINECVENLNNAYSDQSYKRNQKEDYILPFTLHSCGYIVHVDCLGQQIFNTEDDPRDYLENISGEQIITPDGEEAREDLYQYLLQQYHDIVLELIHF